MSDHGDGYNCVKCEASVSLVGGGEVPDHRLCWWCASDALSAANARIAELVEALRPLAAAYSGRRRHADDAPVHMPLMGTSITVGDLRRAVKLVGESS